MYQKTFNLINNINAIVHFLAALLILKTEQKNENIDPTSQKKHKGKSAPFGSAYKLVKEDQERNKKYMEEKDE